SKLDTVAATMVAGDVNSTIACALVSVKRGVPVIHVEAGLRSFDRGMPEEINRVLTDQISDVLLTSEENARGNLLREGIVDERIHFVGNVMIDSLMRHVGRAAPAAATLRDAGISDAKAEGGYALLTMHRPSNVDDPVVLARLLECIASVR